MLRPAAALTRAVMTGRPPNARAGLTRSGVTAKTRGTFRPLVSTPAPLLFSFSCSFLIDLFSVCLSAAHGEPLSHSHIPPETRGEMKHPPSRTRREAASLPAGRPPNLGISFAPCRPLQRSHQRVLSLLRVNIHSS